MHVDTVALVLSVGVLLIAQVLLIHRSLAARRHAGEDAPAESQARELLWAALPAVLLVILLLYSLRHIRVI
jgi:heme/copper-type cytochrome/quinol oxidase subunit 2